ncbi:polymorphic toxin type 17 domain-containing protein [Photobacterium galatheae]|nr:polymorphic toxin type 17 domain-containing protein [Photobacterium galatheae]MCM0147865.1 S-type pyocin domain-containing protein [Photobacterium galatheae]
MSVDDDTVTRKYPKASFPQLGESITCVLPQPVREDPAPVAQFEYSFDLSCSLDALRKHNNCEFFLSKTKEEYRVSNWQEKPVEHGFRLTTPVMVNETKCLYAARACESLGVTEGKPVTVHPKGTDQALEALMAVIPAVEIDGRLGHPSQGYFYHFCNGRLMQEYQILGERRWAFRATHTTHERFRDDYYQGHLSAILLPWKRGGVLVDNQYLVYRRERITRLHLDHLSEDWLLLNGVKIDLNALLDTIKQPALERTAAEGNQQPAPVVKTHTVQRDPVTGERETWPDIAAQYGLNARELLNLNPHYEADPLSLDIGHQLIVQSPDAVDAPKPIRELPPEPPQAFNQALNSHYRYDGPCIEDTIIYPLHGKHLVQDIPVVRIKSVVTPVFAKSCNLPQGSTNAGAAPEPITNFGPFSWFFSSAHANPIGGIIQAQQATQAALSGSAAAGAAGNCSSCSANKDAAVALTRLAGKLDNALDEYRLVASAGVASVFLMPQRIWHNDDTQHTEAELHQLESVQSRIRISLTDPAPGEQYPTVRAWHMNFASIPVLKVDFNQHNQSYSVALEKDGPHLTWLPTETGNPEWQLTPGHEDGFEKEDIHTTPIPDEWFPTVETYPAAEEAHWSDVVLVFPQNSGIAPIYLVYKVAKHTIKGRLKDAQLPTTGKIRFVPKRGYNPSNPLNRGPNKGFIDRFDNEWVKGPSRTEGQAFEWDVQLSKTGRQKLGWAASGKNKSHANISLDGKITH